MTLTTPYQASFYVGDGETKAFPFVFEELSDNFVKVIVSHIDGTTSIPTYTVDLELKQVVFGDETPAPTADDVVCIYRETPTIQDTPFKTLEGYNAKALENILSKIVAMIQEIKSNYFSTQVLQGDPWQLDLLTSADDGATVNIDYTAKKLVKGLYFQITDGNLQVSADGSSYITMPKSSDVAELRQQVITLPDLTVIKKLQYRVNNEWFDAETNAQATADEALALAQSVQSTLNGHLGNTNNPHSVTKAQVGLGNVDNTSDANKPISTATQTALNAKQDTISDLATIRTGASKGATAVQPGDLATVATSGSYNDLSNKPTIGDGTITIKQSGTIKGTFTTNQTGNTEIDLDAGGTGAVSSVNGQTGTVVLTASDVGAATSAQGAKADTAVQPGDLATVATSGAYSDLIGTPTIPAAQVNSDWNANSGVAQILNKPTIPTVNNSTITITQGGTTKGSFTLNQATGDTIALDAGGSDLPSQTGNAGKVLTTDGTDASWETPTTITMRTWGANE